MGKNSKIEWCDHTFNPWIGCQKVSPACEHCYAESWAKRSGLVKWGPGAERRRTSEGYWKQPLAWNRRAKLMAKVWEQAKATYPGVEDDPMFIGARRPRVFCGSLCDVFDNAVPPEWRVDLLALIRATPRLDWLLLTKRIGNAREMLNEAALDLDGVTLSWANNPLKTGPRLDNLWLGITVCNQEEANRDIPKLLSIPAAKRFLSIEPMLEAIDLVITGALGCTCRDLELDDGTIEERCGGRCVFYENAVGKRIEWVIVGGESGPKSRPLYQDWVRRIRDQCAAANVPFFFKQWGEWIPMPQYNGPWDWKTDSDGFCFRIGKKKTGCLLDGREHKEFPA